MLSEMQRLIDIVRQLRAPDGCPWDREQTHSSLLPCLLDESYEFFEAVDKQNTDHMREELGDLLLQIVLHAQMGTESGAFTIEDVARDIADKLIRRHPHVFGDTKVSSTKEVLYNWEHIKKTEKGKEHRKYLVDDIPEALPALFRADKIQKRVSRVGFDWQDSGPALDKVEEEFDEFREAVEAGDLEHATGELGDIFFALVNVARRHGISAEEALRKTNNKFIRRFKYVEDACKKAGLDIKSATLETLDTFWEEGKSVVG